MLTQERQPFYTVENDHPFSDHLEIVCRGLQDPDVYQFALDTISAGYANIDPIRSRDLRHIVEGTLRTLADSNGDAATVARTADALSKKLFLSQDPNGWIRKGYKRYKHESRSPYDIKRIAELVHDGEVVLDIGTGTGFLSEHLKAENPTLKVMLTDIEDLRVNGATTLPFVLKDPSTLPFRNGSVDVSLLVSVAHHIEELQQLAVLDEISRVTARMLIMQEDVCMPVQEYTAVVSEPFAGTKMQKQPNLCEFLKLTRLQQRQALAIGDFVSNRILSGFRHMPTPFTFRSPGEWDGVMQERGFRLVGADYIGFPPGKVTQNSQAWMYFVRQ